MKTYDFINANLGAKVYITGDRDLAMCGELRPLIGNKTPLVLLRLTKGGMAFLMHDREYYTVPPSNIRLYSEIIKE